MSDSSTINKSEMLTRMQEGWDDLQNYLATLTEAQLTAPTDAAGWTAKDHLMHMAVWADGIIGLLDNQSRPERMGIDQETWKSRDFDRINAVIQERHKNLPLADVLEALQKAHAGLFEKAKSMSEEELQRPYNYFEPGSSQDKPVFLWVISDSYDHYVGHTPWIDAIVK